MAGAGESSTLVPEHLQELYQETCHHVTSPSVRQRLAGLLVQRQRAFARNRTDLGSFTKIKHEINTNGAAPVRERVRHTPRGLEGEEEKCLQDHLEAGVNRPSSLAWAAPTILICKSDGTVRWCIDYRRLNDRSVKDAYPLPRIDMCFDSLGGVRHFSTLNLQSGYWQIQVEEADTHKTAFITKYGLIECIKMPFGLCSAPNTFQRCMELVFRGLQWCTVVIYLDDIIILGCTMEENLDRLDEALGRLEEANLKLKPSKCKLLQQDVLFLDHIVSADGVRPNPKFVESIRGWELPKDRHGVQQFLGLCNYYLRFVPDFTVVANTLRDVTSKSKEFEWTASAHQAFEKLKVAPVLSFPLPPGEYILDASDVGVGGVLSQDQNGVERVIAFSSKAQQAAAPVLRHPTWTPCFCHLLPRFSCLPAGTWVRHMDRSQLPDLATAVQRAPRTARQMVGTYIPIQVPNHPPPWEEAWKCWCVIQDSCPVWGKWMQGVPSWCSLGVPALWWMSILYQASWGMVGFPWKCGWCDSIDSWGWRLPSSDHGEPS